MVSYSEFFRYMELQEKLFTELELECDVSGLPHLARRFSYAKVQLQTERQVLQKRLVDRQLRGTGPLATLKRQLGLLKVLPRDRLTAIPEEQQLTTAAVRALVSEHVSKGITGFSEGGLWVPTIKSSKELPEALEDLRTGVYHLGLEGPEPRLILVWQVIGVSTGYILVSCPYKGGTVKIRYTTSCEIELVWTIHDQPEVFSLNGARTGFLALLKTVGYSLPTPISEAVFLKALTPLDALHGLTLHVDTYTLTLTPLPGEPHPHLNLQDEMLKRLRWTDLTPTKQTQFLLALQERSPS